MKTRYGLLVGLLMTIMLAGLSLAQPATHFVATLEGQQVVPPVNTQASGTASFTLSEDGKALQYQLSVKHIMDVTMAHLHMAPRGKNGGIVVWLYPAAPPARPKSGEFSGTLASGTITAAQLAGALAGKPLSALLTAIQAGDIYVNIHTATHPGGELRGQLHGAM